MYVSRVDQPDQPDRPKVIDTVARVLVDAGIDATVTPDGVYVPEDQERRAREVLLTDQGLIGTDVIVVLAISAGTGRKTETGFEVPQIAPDEPIRMRESHGGSQ